MKSTICWNEYPVFSSANIGFLPTSGSTKSLDVYDPDIVKEVKHITHITIANMNIPAPLALPLHDGFSLYFSTDSVSYSSPQLSSSFCLSSFNEKFESQSKSSFWEKVEFVVKL